jgi:outer membrane protein assembly factor BamB
MNYSSGRPLAFLGRLYAVSGKSLVCFDPKQFTIVWTIDLAKRTGMTEDEFAAMPAAANKKIVVSTLSGKVLVVDPLNGIIETTYDLETALKFQPVINEGWIYAGSKEGKLISYNTGNPLLTGWPMWSMNAAHNPVVD